MIKSEFFKRIMLLILATVVLSAILTLVVYDAISKDQFTKMQAQELRPRAESLASYCIAYLDGKISEESFNASLNDRAFIGALPFVFDKDGELITSSNTDIETQIRYRESAKKISNYISQVLEENALETNVKLGETNESYLVIGQKMVNEQNHFYGTLFLIKPMKEISASLHSLNTTLFWSMLVVFLLMVIPAGYVSMLIIRPLNRMRDAALSMAEGDFDIEADESQRGEVGELARSLNHLASRLSKTISALMIERNRLRQIIDGLSEGMIAVDSAGAITHANPAVFFLFAKPYRNPPIDPLWLCDHEMLWEDVNTTIATRTPIVRSLYLKDRVLRVTITPLLDEGAKTVGAVALFHDNTQSEKLEQTRRDYVANVSHELRTPLSSIRSLSETLIDGMVKTEEDKQRYYDYILAESMRMSRLIDDLLELSRLQTGSINVECDEVNIEHVMRDIRERYETLIHQAGIHLVIDPNVKTLPLACTNEDRVMQVLIILLDNAIKYTSQGGTIRIGANVMYDKIRIWVSDTGTGIRPEDINHIFERFYKEDKSHSEQGTGMGLSIAKEVLELMDQEIWVVSEEGMGSTFTFTVDVLQTH